MVKVSVIIPVYNTEKYLQECMDSVVNQTLTDIEIICINDGSTDSSLDILESYAEKDSRIKIISQENNGQGSARNKGLSLAEGEYIYFMDSDDIIKLNLLEDNFKIASEKSLDLTMFQLINYDDENDKYYKTNYYNMSRLADFVKDSVFSYKDLDEIIFNIAVSPVNKLINREFLERIDATFPEDLIFEDNIFFWNVFLNAEKIVFIHEYLYIRRRHSSSTTGFAGIRFIDTLEIHNRIFEIFKQHGIFNKFKSNLFNQKINYANIRFNRVKDDVKQRFFDEMKSDYEDMINEYGYEDILSLLNSKCKLIFSNVIKSRGHEEFILLMEQNNLKSKIKKMQFTNRKLKKEIASASKEKDLILSSTSWKVTKPLRNAGKLIKR